MKLFDKIKKTISNYLDKIGKSNSELFGNEKPDCCKLNKKSNRK